MTHKPEFTNEQIAQFGVMDTLLQVIMPINLEGIDAEEQIALKMLFAVALSNQLIAEIKKI